MKKESFIKKIINSIGNFDSYKNICNYKVSKSWKYFLLLMLIYSIVITIGVTYDTCGSIKHVQEFVQTELTDVHYESGVLSINNNEYKSFYNNYIIIDTSEGADLDSYNGNIVIGRSSFKINVENNFIKFNYSDFINQNFEKNDIIDVLDVKKYIAIIIVISLVVSYIVTCISTLLDILVIALIGLIISGVIGNNKVKFKNAFNISMHAITLPVILGMIYFIINTFTGFYIKYFSTMYTIIANIYMITAVILLNIDNTSTNN